MMQIIENQSLKPYHTFHLPVSTRWWADYSSAEELQELLQGDLLKQNRFFHIGAGSNLLFTHDYDGVVLHSSISFIEKYREDADYIYLRVGSGVVWDDLCHYAVEQGYYGIENLSHIPGEVGASAVQNIGAYGVEVADVIQLVEVVEIATAKPHVFDVTELAYGYRTSLFKKEWKGKYIVTAVCYKLSKQPQFNLSYGNLSAHFQENEPVSLARVRSLIIEVRDAKLPDPEKLGNAGSFFINPVVAQSHFETLLADYPAMPHYRIDEAKVKIPAAWLIEQCEWKGKNKGGAAVHDKQCLVIVNTGEAKAADIIALAEAVQQSVKERFGIDIYPEVNYIS